MFKFKFFLRNKNGDTLVHEGQTDLGLLELIESVNRTYGDNDFKVVGLVFFKNDYLDEKTSQK